MRVAFIEEENIQDLEDFICPICEEDLVHKDFKINKLIGRWGLIALGCFFIGYGLGLWT